MGIGYKRMFASEQKGKCVIEEKGICFLQCLQDLIITQRCQFYLFYGTNICVLQCNWDFRFNVKELCLFFHYHRLFTCLC